jgi:hypothetical protein
VSAPLQAFVFSSYLLNVLLQLANKHGIQNKQNKKIMVAMLRCQSPFVYCY